MRLMTRVVFAEILEESCVSFKKRLKVACPACFVLSLLPPTFYGGWGRGMREAGAAGGRGGDRRRRRPTGRTGREKTNVKAPNVLLAFPFAVRSFGRSFVRSLVRSLIRGGQSR